RHLEQSDPLRHLERSAAESRDLITGQQQQQRSLDFARDDMKAQPTANKLTAGQERHPRYKPNILRHPRPTPPTSSQTHSPQRHLEQSAAESRDLTPSDSNSEDPSTSLGMTGKQK
ncbi:hypothetical protein, partial [Bifidobacterium aquikefiri]